MFSPIQIKQHVFERISLDSNPSGSGNFDIRYHLETKHLDEGSDFNWKALFAVSFGEQKTGEPTVYKGDFKLVGYFKLSSDFPEKDAESFVQMNAGAMLYGAVREMVSILTSRSVSGPLELPTIEARQFIAMRQDHSKQ